MLVILVMGMGLVAVALLLRFVFVYIPYGKNLNAVKIEACLDGPGYWDYRINKCSFSILFPTPSLGMSPSPLLELNKDIEDAFLTGEAKSNQEVDFSLNDQKFTITIPQGFNVKVFPKRNIDPISGCNSIRTKIQTTKCDFLNIEYKSMNYTLWWSNRSAFLGGGGYIPTYIRQKKIQFNNQSAILSTIFEGHENENLGIYYQLIETTQGEPFALYAYQDWGLFNPAKKQDNEKYQEIFLKLASRMQIMGPSY